MTNPKIITFLNFFRRCRLSFRFTRWYLTLREYCWIPCTIRVLLNRYFTGDGSIATSLLVYTDGRNDTIIIHRAQGSNGILFLLLFFITKGCHVVMYWFFSSPSFLTHNAWPDDYLFISISSDRIGRFDPIQIIPTIVP